MEKRFKANEQKKRILIDNNISKGTTWELFQMDKATGHLL